VVECQLPKLDVAGSNPVSRSMFSITCRDFEYPPNTPLSRNPIDFIVSSRLRSR
jgi:hypothetical protein